MRQEDWSLRLAMWSGPRNLSTALMRSWENRPDTMVCDEPFYAHYLSQVPVDHPGRELVIANGECDWRKVVAQLTRPVPSPYRIFYQKHMTHHLLEHISRDWFPLMTHVFLIRDPGNMLSSLGAVLDEFQINDTGLPQQLEIFKQVWKKTGMVPAVIDADDLLQHPRQTLTRLCTRLQIPFHEAMLTWPAGKRESDGVWAPFWYASVERSTGFNPPRSNKEPLPKSCMPLYRRCMAYYEQMHAHRIG